MDPNEFLSRAKPRPLPARPGLIRQRLADLICCAALIALFLILIDAALTTALALPETLARAETLKGM